MLGADTLNAVPLAVSRVTSHPQALKSLVSVRQRVTDFEIWNKNSFKETRSTKKKKNNNNNNKHSNFRL